MKKGRVNRNTPVESPKCSIIVRVRYHATTWRKDILDFPLSFRAKPRNPGRDKGRKKRGGKASRLIRV